jgi:energy-coupling factor transporter ATP-binding protein EcfA2
MKRRDVRRSGPGPYLLGLERDPAIDWGDEFPYDVPAVAAVEAMKLDTPITLLAGDNGTGKSTLVEAFAEAMGFAPEGGELERAGELPPVPRAVLGGALRPVLERWSKPRNGYFLRAESFFNVARFVDGDSTFAPDVSLYGGVGLHQQSHGERPAPARSSSSRHTRRSCSPARAPASTSSTSRASASAPTTRSTPSASRAASSMTRSATSERPSATNDNPLRCRLPRHGGTRNHSHRGHGRPCARGVRWSRSAGPPFRLGLDARPVGASWRQDRRRRAGA